MLFSQLKVPFSLVYLAERKSEDQNGEKVEEMTICLYECLRAAGLQHHYDRFTSVGVWCAAHLSALRMEDYSLLGVHSMEDRTRLFHLVQTVKTLDLKNLANDDVLIYNENVYDGGDEVDGRLRNDVCGNPDEDLSEDQNENKTCIRSSSFATSSCAQRRLEFTVESFHPVQVSAKQNKTNLPLHRKESVTSMQHKLFSKKSVLNGHQESKNNKLDVLKCLHDCQNKDKLHMTQGSSVFHCDVSLPLNSKTSYKLYPSPATVPSKTFNNKSFGLKDQKRLSKKKSYSTDMTHLKPVYEAKRAAGYNYGLPLSSPHAPNNRRVGRQKISVCVRKRPLTRAERRRGEADVATTPSGDCVLVHESKEAVDLTEYILQHRFYFDHVFGEESSNEEVYRKTTFPLVQHMLSGGKATCFAYGQTGAGKTYTMLGSSPGGPGLYALAAQDIFAHLSATYSPQLVYVSFFEIYCGQLYDLLDHRKRLFAREDGQKVVHISGLRNVRVDSVNSLLKVISQGTAERTQGMSGVNPRSSRSHALLQIQLRDLNLQTAGRMCFVDLAGSERASDAKEPDRQTRMEGAEINQSLLALKECIRSLDKEESHTPFRQSKLTQVLKDSFVGDSITCMIANISPGHQATEHTLNTLRYADRVKELRGQGELKENKRCETGPSFKHNVSSSNKSQSHVGALKKPKLKKQSAAFSPNTEDTFLCSTPKNSRCRRETQSRNRREIGLDNMTPVRGWLTNRDAGVWSKRAAEKEGRRMENVRYGSCNSPRVYEQQTKGQGKKEEAVEGCLAVAEVESGFPLRENETTQIRTKESRKETRGQTEILYRCRSNEEEQQRKGEILKDDSKEKMKHLRQYHQQLQQFSPSSASSSVLQSSSTYPSFSSSTQDSFSQLLHSSCSSNMTWMDHNLKGFSNVYTDRVEVNCTRRQIPSLSAEAFVQNETSMKYCVDHDVDVYGSYGGVREDWKAGKCESERKKLVTGEERVRREPKQCARVEEMESANRISTNSEAQLFCSWDSEDNEDLSVEELNASDAPDNGAWSTGQIETDDYYSLESAHNSNENNRCFSQPPFESQHQRAPAERPLSPGNENDIAAVTSDKLKDTSHKSNKPDCNILVLPFQNIPEAVLPSGASRRPFSHVQATTLPVTTTMTHHQDFKAKMSVLPQDETSLESFSYTMDPLSLSLLHVDQQPATASFLQWHISNEDDIKGEVGKQSLSSVEIEKEIVEDAEFHLSLLETIPAASDPPGFTLLSLCDKDNSQENKQTCHQSPLMSLPVQHIKDSSFAVCKPSDHAHDERKTSSCFITTQQLENVPGHLDTVRSNQSSTSKVSPKPCRTAEPCGQEGNNNQQIKPTIHLLTMDSLNKAKWCIVEAHLEQLKEVKALCHKERKLLCQQHDMAFGEYVHKLAEILEEKAKCVHSMRAQLQPYLKSILSNRPSTQGDNHPPAV